MDTLTALDPQSPQAAAMYNLGLVTTIICGVIFVIVAGLIVFAILRCRWRTGDRDPEQRAGHTQLEIAWTIVPLIIVVVLFGLTVRTMGVTDPPPAPEPDLIVTGHQWWWEARYPRTGVIAANEIHIPVGQPLSVQLESTDVLHEFWVPRLTRKMTTVPGRPNHIWLQADEPGTFLGVCSEFCGTQHAWMRFLVIAEPREQFDAWQRAQLAPAPEPTTPAARRGRELFVGNTCINCHAIQGTSATARVAPDLTHLASRRELAGGVLQNNAPSLRRWLQNPQVVKPGVKMPNYRFTDAQLDDLVAYFETLR